MAPEVRRQAIIDAALPLLLAQGTEVSTREIACAAGVAEGTIFRAFETKQELIHATIHAALQPDAAIDQLTELPDAQALDARVTSIFEVLSAEIGRTRSLIAHLFHPPVAAPSDAAGAPRPADSSAPATAPNGPFGHRPFPPPVHAHEGKAKLSAAVSAALEPYADQLAVPTQFAAQVLSALSFATSFSLPDDNPLNRPEELADTVLHGIAKGAR